MTDAALVFDAAAQGYDFGPDHPLRPLRLVLTVDLIRALGLHQGDGVALVPPRGATDAELHRIHDPAYVEAVRRLSHDPGRHELGRRYGFGSPDNPAFPGMHDVAALIAGGSVRAAEGILAGEFRRAFHPAGGLHHAMRARASGFCVYNDAACAIARFLEAGWRVLYVDGDAHHGDGVEEAFAGDPRVLTISLHEDGRFLFPGTGFVEERGHGAGFGFAVNVPLLPGTDDASWLEAFDTVVPPLARAFRPDVIVTQHGCDAHRWDPLADLAVTTRALEAFARAMDGFSRELCDGRWVALGGGGYDPWRVVPRAWSLVWGAVAGREVPDAVPDAWLERWRSRAPVALPERMRDDAVALPPGAATPPGVAERNRETARRALAGALDRVRSGSKLGGGPGLR